MVRTAGILQRSVDPSQGLLRQGLHLGSLTLAEQLHQSSAEQFGTASLPTPLQLMPVAVINAEQTVQVPGLGKSFLRPHGLGSIHGVVPFTD